MVAAGVAFFEGAMLEESRTGFCAITGATLAVVGLGGPSVGRAGDGVPSPAVVVGGFAGTELFAPFCCWDFASMLEASGCDTGGGCKAVAAAGFTGEVPEAVLTFASGGGTCTPPEGGG